jgi:hypothetical protein
MAVLLVQRFVGQHNVVTIPAPFIAMTGDYVTAALLAQVMYHHDREGGIFQKTDDEFGKELHLSPYQLGRARKALEAFGVTSRREGIPARMWYDLDAEKLERQLLSFLGTGDQVSSDTSYEETQEHSLYKKLKEKIVVSSNDTLLEKSKSKPSPGGEFPEVYAAWNANRGALRKSEGNQQANKLIRVALKYATYGDLVERVAKGAKVVSGDPYWLEKNYGLVNLLRNLDGKVEEYDHRGGMTGATAKAKNRWERTRAAVGA